LYIDRPIAEVFAYVADQTKTTSWCLGMTECRLTSNSGMQPGAVRHVEVKTPLGKARWDFGLENFEQDRTIVWSDLKSSIPMVDTYSFEAKDGGTLFSHHNEYVRLPPLLSMLQPLFIRRANRTIRKDNLALKGILEGRS